MTNAEIITAQQNQIDALLAICDQFKAEVEQFEMQINWQKLEIDILKDRQFVKNDN